MTDYPLISVIVPVYNVEEYVRTCVESLIVQTYPNLEIILVDDGATDSSGSICDELAAVHENVTCHHKANGGLSDARNYGLMRSHGSWISFVDSDDYVSPSFISVLYEAAIVCDCPIAAVPGGKFFNDGEECKLLEEVRLVVHEQPFRSTLSNEMNGVVRPLATAPLSAHETMRKMFYQEIGTGAQWRLYRRDVLGENPFPVGIYYEDMASTYKFVNRAGRVTLVDCYELYAYRLRFTSILRQPYCHMKGVSALIVSNQLYSDICEWYPDLADAAASRCFSVCRMVYAQVPTRTIDGATEDTAHDADALWSELTKKASVVRKDTHARKRERLASSIVCMGRTPFNLFCCACRKIGLLQ